MENRRSEQGNVLFLILIAVALFAALSYAVTQSTRSGGGDAGKETLATQAAQITQYASYMENTILRMRLSGNCTEALLNFDNPHPDWAVAANPSAPADNHCDVFHPSGGGVSPQAIDSEWRNSPGTGTWKVIATCVPYIGTGDTNCSDNSSASEEELVLLLYYIAEDLCVELNERLGIPNPGGRPPLNSLAFIITPAFVGTYVDNPTIYGISGDSGELNGTRSGCALVAANIPTFYHVLLPR